ncbi:alpha/beta fold hydrolase [Dictyobacter aurantiacus]|uniref:Oxidoreductase n=1 Tax=Dictyobacter aurantiacus TaxID=1936993 RepID=A0A401ZI92_9CHLR|nr:alpha/beta hydrolase [Dictyobacter aurantiacus]GCE06565.1 oxidoreductase [Dictyobacter aurantiacus]
MQKVELSAGTIEYEDTGGSGPVVVLLHGLLMDGSAWRHVVRELRATYRCIVPTLPVGGHRLPMRANADLSLLGLAQLQAEFLEALDLREVTLVGNDLGAFLATAGEHPERLARLVITSCEAFENIPSGLPGHTISLAAKIPGGLNAMVAQPLRIRAMRRLPIALGPMAKRPIPHELTDAWLRPLFSQKEVRRDLLKYLRHSSKADLLAATKSLSSFKRPALVVWTPEDRMMPPANGKRLTALLPQARLVEITDSLTLIPLDQPEKLAQAIHQFIQDTL